ncbi:MULTISPECIES: hypothetical protein [Streptomyces]|uniref:Uncharacterized protein n=1 Tax=Streptomyces alboflavus TaxID=67267 RepID=A0A1Z1W3G5_9ACTN|nr:hypothetical protein [Streptomyces alboflavus]ARX80978.1 hypothetical protein SMD44_00376 [Streptomyces alboflavus]
MHRARFALPALTAATVTVFGLGLAASVPAVSPLAGTPQRTTAAGRAHMAADDGLDVSRGMYVALGSRLWNLWTHR